MARKGSSPPPEPSTGYIHPAHRDYKPFSEIIGERIGAKLLIDKLVKELNAKETKFFQHEGEVVSKEDVIAWPVRQKARMDAHRLRGDYPAEEQKIEGEFTVLAPAPLKKPKNSGK